MSDINNVLLGERSTVRNPIIVKSNRTYRSWINGGHLGDLKRIYHTSRRARIWTRRYREFLIYRESARATRRRTSESFSLAASGEKTDVEKPG